MDKIKCIESENGTIIPIHNIALISAKDASRRVWTNCDTDDIGHKISDKTYNVLLDELDIIADKRFID